MLSRAPQGSYGDLVRRSGIRLEPLAIRWLSAMLNLLPDHFGGLTDFMPPHVVLALSEISMFVRVLGQVGNRKPLVVLHGGPDWDHSYLLPGLTGLAESRQVLLPDMRGCGRSSRGLGVDRYQPAYVVSDLLEMLVELGHDEVDLVGFSTGGQVAQLFVEAHPRRVRRLVLASTTAYPVARRLPADESQAVDPRWPAWAQERYDALDSDGRETLRMAVDHASSMVADPGMLPDYLDLLSGVRFGGEWMRPFRRGLIGPWRPVDPIATLRAFARPVLILHGAADAVFPVELARRLGEEVPNARLCELEGIGHMAHFEQPLRWAAAVASFSDVTTAKCPRDQLVYGTLTEPRSLPSETDASSWARGIEGLGSIGRADAGEYEPSPPGVAGPDRNPANGNRSAAARRPAWRDAYRRPRSRCDHRPRDPGSVPWLESSV
jgi:pimeloyl-ACP methyl ester carboxylesterase